VRVLTVGNMYPPHHLGGYELTWASAVAHLRAAGHEVWVLTTDYRNPAPDPHLPEDPRVARELRWYWRDHEFPRISIPARVSLERHNARVLERQLDDLRPDVVSWWAMGGMSLSLIELVRRAGRPAMGVVGDDWMVYGPNVDAWTRLVGRLGPVGRLAGALVGVPARLDLSPVLWVFNSEATRRRAGEAGLRLERAEVANPGVDTGLFRKAPEHDWGWRLLYVGRIDERKGVDLAVQTLTQLPDQARLTVLGSGDERFLDDLRRLCRRLGVDRRVAFGMRPRRELPAAYAEADVLLFPVRWEEPWGLVPLEAMAVGTPVVTSGKGGSREYLRAGDNALVVGDAGPPELAAAVRRLQADQGLRSRLREGGLRTAARYTERSYNETIAAALERAAAE
jgi:glycogen(starch) synthase